MDKTDNFLIGIHRGHNSSIALLKNGVLDFAIQEERISRIKNHGDMPLGALLAARQLLPLSNSLTFAYSGKRITKQFWQRQDLLNQYARSNPSLLLKIKRNLRRINTIADRIDNQKAKLMVKDLEKSSQINHCDVKRIEHHSCHAAAAYWGWGRLDDKILIITCDGAGDGICASVSVGYKGKIERLCEIEESHSIGRLYANITYLMGMLPLEHEYKVMGLAPYAERSTEAEMLANTFSELFVFDPSKPLVWRRANNCPPMDRSLSLLKNIINLKRFDYIASGTQLFIENFLSRWVRNCICETGITKVALAGGVFMNVKGNLKILKIPELDELYVFPSCGDETNAIGAIFDVYSSLNRTSPSKLSHLYLGDSYENAIIENFIHLYPFTNKIRVTEIDDIEKTVAGLIAKGEIVARFSDRMEFGARALGNRSILAPASDRKVVRVINQMIKSRDFWMPFCPSVIAERSDEYFSKPKEMSAPYMIICFDAKKEKIEKMAATLHPYDFTGRPQEVSQHNNHSYYKLLKYYEELTGEGIILNTSFNLHGEPIVHSPEDALRVFDISGLEHLAIGNFLLTKRTP